jgi:hypothetical protein
LRWVLNRFNTEARPGRWDREFESALLQRGVSCEPDFVFLGPPRCLIARRSKVGGHFAKRVGSGETAKRQALAIGYLAKIASIRFERLVDWLIGFGSARDDFREGLLITCSD